MAGNTMTGARGILYIDDPATNTSRAIGIFNSVNWSLTYGVEPVFVLGSYGPVESVYTSMEATQITASGFRVIDHGPHLDGAVPKLEDLLRHQYMSMSVLDRQTNKTMAKFRQVRPVSYSTGLSHRQLEEVTINYIALRCEDESVDMNESAGASSFP